ncbi:MAG: hypothetical protein NTV34_06650 [Proteobacteria bacterium]|nr:hypothetical protein [Pseudomonadota bacterium]
MPTFVDSSKTDFTRTPHERRQRQELSDAMATVKSALDLLTERHDALSADLRSRTIVTSSKQCLSKLQTFVDQTLKTES